LVKRLISEKPDLDIFFEIPYLVAHSCGFEKIFCLHDEIEYTYPKFKDNPKFCFNTRWKAMAIDPRFVLLAAGTNLFAMGLALLPNRLSTIPPTYRGVQPISLGIVDAALYKKTFSEDMNDFIKTLGGYPGYIALSSQGKYGLTQSVLIGVEQDFENLRTILCWYVDEEEDDAALASIKVNDLLHDFLIETISHGSTYLASRHPFSYFPLSFDFLPMRRRWFLAFQLSESLFFKRVWKEAVLSFLCAKKK